MQETTCGDKGVEFNVGFLFLNPNGILSKYCYAFVFLTSSLPHHLECNSSLVLHLFVQSTLIHISQLFTQYCTFSLCSS